ncbi:MULTISPECIES: cyclopropane-fatty-acyl-phospholipid synthase family protein [unclassified Thioalkalivibrio]|uniref:SAM-dependent methyltransferase n=1 Tax=unclassified Thioalkalivibrio TaxID=2621013 RepID=UPI0003765E5C|nr:MULTISPECIES: cyclopropane-fatty-acyl-phospholipid synthase family protein [unclassified Thioalkalivibrio]
MSVEQGSATAEFATRRHWALRLIARTLSGLEHGQLTLVGPRGEREVVRGAQSGREAIWHLKRPWRTLLRILRHGDLGFAEGYIAGDWNTPDLKGLLHLATDNEAALADLAARPVVQRQFDALRHWWHRNSRRGSRANIRFHYDLGNDFYRLWLDPSMSYSAALFSRGDEALESAQQRKYERLLDQLDAAPGSHILEIGCGWGGFAELAARRGHQVTAITLSQEQLDYARERIERAGLSDRVELRLQDYRDVTGQFDHVVSIEMFEAVGQQWWPGFFETVRASLRPGGRAALQVITIDEAAFDYYRNNADFIQLYVFPGGMLPSVPRFNAAARQAGLAIGDQRFFGQDYAETLRRWDREVRHAEPVIEALGYSPEFLRMWRYYLAYCEVGFEHQRVDLMQVVLEPRDRDERTPHMTAQ